MKGKGNKDEAGHHEGERDKDQRKEKTGLGQRQRVITENKPKGTLAVVTQAWCTKRPCSFFVHFPARRTRHW